jgi:hypothetical protein
MTLSVDGLLRVWRSKDLEGLHEQKHISADITSARRLASRSDRREEWLAGEARGAAKELEEAVVPVDA